jgi:hypothetical protein
LQGQGVEEELGIVEWGHSTASAGAGAPGRNRYPSSHCPSRSASTKTACRSTPRTCARPVSRSPSLSGTNLGPGTVRQLRETPRRRRCCLDWARRFWAVVLPDTHRHGSRAMPASPMLCLSTSPANGGARHAIFKRAVGPTRAVGI